MKPRSFIAYYRVSTQKQGVSGLGLAAQKSAVASYIKNVTPVASDSADKFILIAEFQDIESGKNNRRPQLQKAIDMARKSDAVLLIAKLDRLSRNLTFISSLQDAHIKFVCCDMPEANELTIHLMAALAQWERKQISARTKAALEAKMKNCKGKGFIDRHGNLRMTLGNPDNFTQEGRDAGVRTRVMRAINDPNNRRALAMADKLKSEGKTLQQIAEQLNTYGFPTSTGCEFSPEQVRRLFLLRDKQKSLA